MARYRVERRWRARGQGRRGPRKILPSAAVPRRRGRNFRRRRLDAEWPRCAKLRRMQIEPGREARSDDDVLACRGLERPSAAPAGWADCPALDVTISVVTEVC